jgi:oligoribonuclease NrnB/cAMP/cGMP phosphodiesterase (DHH superfamily)
MFKLPEGGVKVIVAHAKCADGLASALILHDVFPDAEVKLIQYGSPEQRDLPVEPGMLFCDIGPVKDRAQEFVDAGAAMLDHHGTAREVVEMFGDRGVFGDEAKEPGVSGTVLAFREVWIGMALGGPHERPSAFMDFVKHFATLAGIRDTWQKTNPLWPAACDQQQWLSFVPAEEALALGLSGIYKRSDTLTWIGEILTKKHQDHIAQALKGSYRFTTPKGTRVMVFQGCRLSSDLSEKAADTDLVAGFDYFIEEGNIKLVFSVRSRTNYDCAALAKAYGGGGHLRAAGFGLSGIDMTEGNPYATFKLIVEAMEKNP